jgi:hypothetical protein
MLEDDGAVRAPVSQKPGIGFDPANSRCQESQLRRLPGAGPHAALAAGASFSHHAEGGEIFPDGAGMPDPSHKHSTNQPGS